MKAIGVIPSRFGSTRFEGKALAMLAGKPMIEHVWRRASRSQLLQEVLIATDDSRIFDAALGFGARALMTSKDHPSGTDRIAEAIRAVDAELVVNIQGDEPLIEHTLIDELVQVLDQDACVPMATCVKKITNTADIQNPHVVKVVLDKRFFALYFSRSPIPFNRDGDNDVFYYKHIGIYAYRKDFLLTFPTLAQTPLEQAEKLEQLRVLEAGFRIKAVVTGYDSIGVDTPEDLRRVACLLENEGVS